MADQDTPPPTITAMKIPIIKKGEYDIWSMRMRQYICHTDHNLWDIIVNGDLEDEATPSGEQSSPPVPKTAKQLAARRNQERIKSILLLAIPDEYLLKFHNVPDAKSLWAAIKSRFGGNEESKKMQKNVLKHQFENFVTASNETLDKAYDRFQKLISQLEIHGAYVSKEDINQKFLRSLPPSWSQIALIMRNKPDIDEFSLVNMKISVYTKVSRLLAIPTPPPSPLSPLSSPLPHILSPLPQILSPPLLVSSPPLPVSPTYPLGYRAAMIRLRAEKPSTFHLLPLSTPPSGTPPLLPISLPTPSPPTLLPSTVCLRYEVGDSSSSPTARPTGGFRADYGYDEMVEDMQGTPTVTDVVGLSQRMTDFVTTVRQDTNEIYVRLDDARDERLLMRGQLNMLRRDRRAHARTARLMETEARLSREAWVQSMYTSDTARFEVRALRTIVLAHQTEITGLRAADRTRQAQLMETLTLMRTLQT
ncbi:hypothetical protein Tco_0003284 [Tanacetum coccineum]